MHSLYDAQFVLKDQENSRSIGFSYISVYCILTPQIITVSKKHSGQIGADRLPDVEKMYSKCIHLSKMHT